MEKISFFDFIGLPATFSSVLILFAFILFLSPYFSGIDFGLFKIPKFSSEAKRRLKYIGPAALIVCVLLFIPFFPRSLPVIDTSAEIAKATKELSATSNGDYDLQARLSGIYTLRSLADQNTSEDYYQQAIDILEIYIKTNIDDRRREGPGITLDRGTYYAEDIVAAFKAIQHIRKASNGKAQVDFRGINFDNINFGDADLSYFDLGFSTFNNAILPVNCKNTNFEFAEFYNAAIWNSDFSGTNFHKANLTGAKFANVDFSGSNIEEAFYHDSVALMVDAKGLTDYQRSLFPPDILSP